MPAPPVWSAKWLANRGAYGDGRCPLPAIGSLRLHNRLEFHALGQAGHASASGISGQRQLPHGAESRKGLSGPWTTPFASGTALGAPTPTCS